MENDDETDKDVQKEVENSNSSLIYSQEQLEELESRKKQLEEQIKELRRKYEEQQKRVRELKELVERHTRQIEELKQELEEKRHQYRIQEAKQQVVESDSVQLTQLSDFLVRQQQQMISDEQLGRIRSIDLIFLPKNIIIIKINYK
jgi:chromosome segregation ATPase